jgi:hypothetical protein
MCEGGSRVLHRCVRGAAGAHLAGDVSAAVQRAPDQLAGFVKSAVAAVCAEDQQQRHCARAQCKGQGIEPPGQQAGRDCCGEHAGHCCCVGCAHQGGDHAHPGDRLGDAPQDTRSAPYGASHNITFRRQALAGLDVAQCGNAD